MLNLCEITVGSGWLLVGIIAISLHGRDLSNYIVFMSKLSLLINIIGIAIGSVTGIIG